MVPKENRVWEVPNKLSILNKNPIYDIFLYSMTGTGRRQLHHDFESDERFQNRQTLIPSIITADPRCLIAIAFS